MEIVLEYVGRTILVGNKIGHKYIDGKHNETYSFAKKLRDYQIGTLISCKRNDDGNSISGPYERVGIITDELVLAEYKAKDWLTYKNHQLEKGFKKVPPDTYTSAINDLRSIIRTLPRNQQELFRMKINKDLI